MAGYRSESDEKVLDLLRTGTSMVPFKELANQVDVLAADQTAD
jgi:hypothetical protein